MTNLEKIIADWCRAYPATTNYFKKLNANKVRWAIFAGTSVSLLANNRTPTDIDIIVHDDDFEAVMNLTPDAKRQLPLECELPTGDGKALYYQGNELWFKLDGTELEVMANAKKTVSGHVYNVSFTDLAVENLIAISALETIVYIANPFDTAAIKSIMQRGPQQNKFDFEDTKALVAKCDFAADYMVERSKQMDLDKRALDFLHKAGLTFNH